MAPPLYLPERLRSDFAQLRHVLTGGVVPLLACSLLSLSRPLSSHPFSRSIPPPSSTLLDCGGVDGGPCRAKTGCARALTGGATLMGCRRWWWVRLGDQGSIQCFVHGKTTAIQEPEGTRAYEPPDLRLGVHVSFLKALLYIQITKIVLGGEAGNGKLCFLS